MAMNDLISKTNQIFIKVQTEMEKLDNLVLCNNFESFKKEYQISDEMLNQASLNCEKLEMFLRKEPVATRSHSKLLVDQLRYDLQHIRSAIRNIEDRMNQKQQEVRDREMLMSRSYESKQTSSDRTSILMEQGLEEHKRLSSSVKYMDRLLENGSNILTGLTDQRNTLKGAHRKLMDVVNTLGLSGTVMRMIERRSSQDKAIFFVGCFIILALLFVLWRLI